MSQLFSYRDRSFNLCWWHVVSLTANAQLFAFVRRWKNKQENCHFSYCRWTVCPKRIHWAFFFIDLHVMYECNQLIPEDTYRQNTRTHLSTSVMRNTGEILGSWLHSSPSKSDHIRCVWRIIGLTLGHTRREFIPGGTLEFPVLYVVRISQEKITNSPSESGIRLINQKWSNSRTHLDVAVGLQQFWMHYSHRLLLLCCMTVPEPLLTAVGLCQHNLPIKTPLPVFPPFVVDRNWCRKFDIKRTVGLTTVLQAAVCVLCSTRSHAAPPVTCTALQSVALSHRSAAHP